MAGVRQFDEEAALEKALGLFWQKGFADTSMQELAAVTGVQRGSLYNAYQGKEEIFLRVFALYRERNLAAAREALAKPVLRDALRGFFNMVITSITTGQPSRSCMATKSALGGEVVEAPIREALQGMMDGYETLLRERMLQAGEDETLALPAADAARLIIVFTRGVVVIERMYQDVARLHAAADMLMTLLLGAETGKPKRRSKLATA
jgi:TetR/AcrR family transcriptional repressor of nem operon